jgi:hypothetical protein
VKLTKEQADEIGGSIAIDSFHDDHEALAWINRVSGTQWKTYGEDVIALAKQNDPYTLRRIAEMVVAKLTKPIK